MAITSLKKLKEDTARDLRGDFYEYGWNNPRGTWLSCLKFARVRSHHTRARTHEYRCQTNPHYLPEGIHAGSIERQEKID
jgi:hypothetical protein